MTFEQISKHLYDDFFVFKNAIEIKDLDDIFTKHFNIPNIKYSQTTLQSFIHKSFKHEHQLSIGNNEKLEFLGDSVLQLVITEKLFKLYQDKTEGELSKIRSAIVNEDSLSKLATLLGLGSWILLGKGELKEKGFEKSSLLANTFEAVLGSIYLDHSMSGALEFLDFCLEIYEKANGKSLLSESVLISFDAKTKLQEIVMKKYKTTPEYKWSEVEEDGQKLFNVEVIINNSSVDKVIHRSKKKAMQILAKQILEKNILN